MNIIECEKNGIKGFKFGESGICHIGLEAKQRAMRDKAKHQADLFRESPRELSKKFKKIDNSMSKKQKK